MYFFKYVYVYIFLNIYLYVCWRITVLPDKLQQLPRRETATILQFGLLMIRVLVIHRWTPKVINKYFVVSWRRIVRRRPASTGIISAYKLGKVPLEILKAFFKKHRFFEKNFLIQSSFCEKKNINPYLFSILSKIMSKLCQNFYDRFVKTAIYVCRPTFQAVPKFLQNVNAISFKNIGWKNQKLVWVDFSLSNGQKIQKRQKISINFSIMKITNFVHLGNYINIDWTTNGSHRTCLLFPIIY